MKLEYSLQILVKHVTIFMKIRPLRVDMFHADEQTDRHDEADSRFSKFCDHTYNG